MEKLIAYCGLDCSKCDARIATLNNDDELRKKTAALWSKLNQVEILPEHINCEGCRVDGKKTGYCESLCQIRKCAASKNFETCGDCAQMNSCEKLSPIVSTNDAAKENLLSCRGANKE